MQLVLFTFAFFRKVSRHRAIQRFSKRKTVSLPGTGML
jgi:hypothetical protein